VTDPFLRCLRASAAVLLFSACDAAPPAPIVFGLHTLARDTSAACASAVGCAEIHLSWLEASGGAPRATDRMNAAIRELLRASDDTPTSEASPELVAAGFQRAFELFRRANPEAPARWQLTSAVSIPWKSARGLVTFDAVSFAVQGGAHPVSSEHYRVVDSRDGHSLALADIITDQRAATPVVERFFRRAKQIPRGESLRAYGWSFTGDQFTLPPNVGLNADGVIFHWNQYAIGPYVAGMTTLVVPYDSLRPALAARVLP
jgi:hypothetical protein